MENDAFDAFDATTVTELDCCGGGKKSVWERWSPQSFQWERGKVDENEGIAGKSIHLFQYIGTETMFNQEYKKGLVTFSAYKVNQ